MDKLTFSEQKRFKEVMQELIPSTVLEDAVSWISEHLVPEQVFSKDELESWASENGFIKETTV